MISTRQIASALGGEVAGTHTVLCPGPGHSSRDRSLAVRLDPSAPDGFICFSHCGDDWRACRDHVRERLGLPAWQPGDEWRRSVPDQHVVKWDLAAGAAEGNDVPRSYTEDEIDRINFAQRIWNEATNPRGTLAEKYLREQRKLDLPDELAGAVLRFHGACPWRNETTGTTDHVPALIVPFHSIGNDEITAIHRIALNDDGSKRGRRMLGIVRHTAIKLDPINNSGRLVVGEGIETALAARQYMTMNRIERMPVWAAGSAGAISFFPLINSIRKLFILGENNDGGANQRAIELCRARWRRCDRKVVVIQPCQPFNDMNDALIADITEKIAS
jgi:putative DNA primase/helicase